MDDLESRLGSILADPEMMGKIMQMAQSLGRQQAPPDAPQPEPAAPDFDPATIQKLSSLMGKANMDANQKALLAALSPYVSGSRIGKLERAMRAAKLAGLAVTFLGNAPPFLGR